MTSAVVLLFFCIVVFDPINPASGNDETTTLPEGYTVYSVLGTAYKVFNDSATWFIAKERCSRDGGSLAVIDSIFKYRLISFQPRLSRSGDTFIGIYLGKRPDKFLSPFIWRSATTGLPILITDIPWGSDTSQGGLPRLYDGECLSVNLHLRGVKRSNCEDWADGFVCELPIPANYLQ